MLCEGLVQAQITDKEPVYYHYIGVPDTSVDHKRHTQEQKNYTLHTHLPPKPVFWGMGVGRSFRRV